MRLREITSICMLIILAQSTSADDGRFSPLIGSGILERMETARVWEIEILSSGIKYKCLKCDGNVDAMIEVIAPYAPEKYTSIAQRYLAERKLFCAHLVIQGNGRCVETRSIGYRAGLLRGFESTHETSNQRSVEMVFFYRNLYFAGNSGPELIRTSVMIDNGATLPNDALETFYWHMAKLTAFW
ncbi:hypothetical protein [Sulfitobacter pacificus]|uniref:Uncharacterized protein n=1 Tax=Sulfitobacter pacificus TaxID=1499314 RepID=A0ABQ5VJZ3_9RHOB|nr:hypothetical protein [Sulfitobacter pacificus]GLQ27364.1 hypothetical protein GCM10007927_21670 [Sulfitobacter pacificus]